MREGRAELFALTAEKLLSYPEPFWFISLDEPARHLLSLLFEGEVEGGPFSHQVELLSLTAVTASRA